MTHLVLLGDSVFDNAPYVNPGDTVIDCLRRKLPADWTATLLAVDGAIATEVAAQARSLPADATHLFVSVGGNDALQQLDYLYQEADSVAGVLMGLARRVQQFCASYEAAIASLQSAHLPLTVCTIYEPQFEQPEQQQVATTALTLWNDRIIQTAIAQGLPILELRQVFTSPADYANPIEPGARGADKLSDWMMAITQQHDFTTATSVLYGRSPAGSST